MATLTIRNVDAGVKERLRVRAARHGRSMEAEARSILNAAVAADRDQPEPNLAEAIRLTSCSRERRYSMSCSMVTTFKRCLRASLSIASARATSSSPVT